jgi:diguanylate cyclase (GGDEF)-like protein
MRPASWPTMLRWTSIGITALVQTALACLLLTGRPAAACGVAAAGLLLQAILLGQYHARLVHAVYRVADLEADLAVANTDPVTGLALRRVAEAHLHGSVGSDVTVALVDVDDMHAINDAVGHGGGDMVLAAVADRLTRAAEAGDLVARLGGDEFVLVTGRDPHELARVLAAAFTQPVTIGAARLPVRVSIGICRVPGGDPRVALGCADLAMYAAKRRGSVIAHYDPARDGVPLSHGDRPPVRHRDRGRPRRPDGST